MHTFCAPIAITKVGKVAGTSSRQAGMLKPRTITPVLLEGTKTWATVPKSGSGAKEKSYHFCSGLGYIHSFNQATSLPSWT